MKVLVACECSGRVRDAFLSKGHDAFSCDILPDVAGSDRHLQCDVREKLVSPYVWDLIIAHPPCTALCVTGNRHYGGSTEREEAIKFFRLFLETPCQKVCVENPVGVISSAIRKPDQYIQPYQFGHPVTKKTGLWLKGLPLLQPTCMVQPQESVVFSSGKKMSQWFYDTSCLPQSERASARSVTFQGIANAMAEQWG